MRKVQRILKDRKGKKYLVKDVDDDFHTSDGVISKADLQKPGVVKSSKDKTFVVLEPQFSDLSEQFHRGPQLITPKDVGLILAKTGANASFSVLDAGGGSGALSLALANVCDHVTIYEINPEHLDVIHKNIALCGAENVALKHQNIYQGIDEDDLDLLTLDLPEPWRVIPHAYKALKVGGHLVVYLPNLTQVKEFINHCGKGIHVIETVELLLRNWKIEDKIMRPEFQMLGHTGFLIFCRKF